MDLGLHDMAVMVTGASGGIGRAVAEVLAAEGCRVALHAGRQGDALEAWRRAQPWAERAVVVRADVSDSEAVDAAWAEAEAALGRIDLAVANAGVWPPEALALHELPPARLRDTLAVNLMGAAWTARAWMASLARLGPRADGRGAAWIGVGSTAGRFGEAGHADYAMSKAGLHGLMCSLKNEVVHLDPYARVNVVSPGWTVTEMARAALDEPGAVEGVLRTMPVRQLARPVDVARVIATLLSPAVSRHVSGENVTVAGGMEGRVQWDVAEIDAAAVRARLDVDP